jgi:hypothetical protein
MDLSEETGHVKVEGWEESPPPSDTQSQTPPADDETLLRARRVARVVTIASIFALAVAVVVNGLWVTQWGPQRRSFAQAAGIRSEARYEPASMPAVGGPVLDLLIPTIIGYETIARQVVPGTDGTQAEAVYASLNMEVQVQVPVSIYARAERYGTREQADERVAKLVAEYPREGRQATINGLVPAYVGFTEPLEAYIIVWIRDTSVCYVKTTFLRHPPAERRRELLGNTAAPVAAATEVYQRTGKSGIELGVTTGMGVQ